MYGSHSTTGLPSQLHFSENRPVAFDSHHSTHDEKPILTPLIGLALRVRVPPETTGGALTAIATLNALGHGPPLHRHRETEIFYVLEGHYLFEVDGLRFEARTGDARKRTPPGNAWAGSCAWAHMP